MYGNGITTEDVKPLVGDMPCDVNITEDVIKLIAMFMFGGDYSMAYNYCLFRAVFATYGLW